MRAQNFRNRDSRIALGDMIQYSPLPGGVRIPLNFSGLYKENASVSAFHLKV